MPVPGGVEHREAPERLPDAARTPWELRISPEIRRFPGWSKTLRCRVRRAMVRPDAEDASTRGDERGRKPLRRPGDHELRRGLPGSGTTAVEPGRTGSSAWEAAELSTSYSSEFEAVEHRGRKGAAGAATHSGLPARKSRRSENPTSGSGPSESARLQGEQTVEGVRNPEDGWCRALDGPGDTDPCADVAEGARKPRRGVPVRHDRGGPHGQNPERAAKSAGAAGRSSDRSDGRTAEHLAVVQTTWRDAVEPMSPLRRTERSERRAEPCEGRPGDGDVPAAQS
jgi:hypothetical protein